VVSFPDIPITLQVVQYDPEIDANRVVAPEQLNLDFPAPSPDHCATSFDRIVSRLRQRVQAPTLTPDTKRLSSSISDGGTRAQNAKACGEPLFAAFAA
jgi:hypothetical protein